MSNFQGFPKAGINFLGDLRANNNKEWFTEHKSIFQQKLEAPAKAFAEQLAEDLALLSGVAMQAKLFRIYRDVRFSKDKTPYKTHVHMLLRARDSKAGAQPAFFFGLELSELVIGAGCFEFGKEVLPLYQNAVYNPSRARELQDIIDALAAQGMQVRGEQYKRVPAGFASDYQHADLLRRKGLSIWQRQAHPPELSSPALLDFCLQLYQMLHPFYNWLTKL